MNSAELSGFSFLMLLTTCVSTCNQGDRQVDIKRKVLENQERLKTIEIMVNGKPNSIFEERGK